MINYSDEELVFDGESQGVYFRDVQRSQIKRKVFLCLLIAFYFFVLFSLIADLLFSVKYTTMSVEDISMQPTINPSPIETEDGIIQDEVYIEYTDDIDYGDIIIVDRTEFKPPTVKDKKYYIIKRALAFEGDQISIVKLPVGENGEYEMRFVRIKKGDSIDNIVYTGQDDPYVIYEDYLLSYEDWTDSNRVIGEDFFQYDVSFYETFLNGRQTTTHNIIFNSGDSEQTIPVQFFTVGSDKDENAPDQIFYMGDNRVFSGDCRDSGTDSVDNIYGKVVRIIRDGNNSTNLLSGVFNRVVQYLSIIWEEIVKYFTV